MKQYICSHFMLSWCGKGQLSFFQCAARWNMFFDMYGGQRKVNYSELVCSKCLPNLKSVDFILSDIFICSLSFHSQVLEFCKSFRG
jgi:hypothetical protein